MKAFIISILLFINLHGFGQSDTLRKWRPTSVIGNVSYIIEEKKAFEIMVGKGFLTDGHNYIVGVAGFGAYKNDSWTPYPMIGIKSAKLFNDTWGFNCNTFLWWPIFEKNLPLTFTPELGLRWAFIEIGFGYNIPLGQNNIEVSDKRITIRLGI